LVDDDQVVFGHDLVVLHRIDRQQRMVRHDHVRVARGATSLLRETIRTDGTLCDAETLLGADRGLPPGAFRYSGNQVVPIAGFGLPGPFPQPLDLGLQFGTGTGVEQGCFRRLLLLPTFESMQTQVVAPALQDRERRCTTEWFT